MGQIQGRTASGGSGRCGVFRHGRIATELSRLHRGRQPVGVDAKLSFDAKMWVVTLAGLYNLETRPEGTVDVLFGADFWIRTRRSTGR